MPSVNIYIREDDMEKWNAIEKKSEWISERLNKMPLQVPKPPVSKPGVDIAKGPTTQQEIRGVSYESGDWGA